MRYGYRRSGANPILIIIIINVMLLIATYINQGFIIRNLGLWPAFFLEQPWTIITSMFVHAGFGHLFGNMLTLFFFGTYLSQLVGDRRFLTVYFGGGLLGNILYLLLAPSFSVAVGASGAVYAVAGTLLMMRPKLRVLLYFIVPMPLWLVILVFFVIFSFLPGVAWQAHLGGLLFGMVAGYIFRKKERSIYF
ncbi:rhomboid family intramembrane serine protease [Chloroflexota bacterium]